MEGATGCLRAARFARNFFEKSFEILPRMIKFTTRLGGGQFFFFETADLVVADGSSGGPSLRLPGRFAPKTARFARERVPKKLRLFIKTF